jgi:chromosome segregation ATPase
MIVFFDVEVLLPRPSNQLLELARLGAQERLKELRAEIAAIHRAYPDLRAERGDRRAPVERPRRRRRRMSAAARKAVSVRMRAYWAARRRAAGK